jgi:Protein of unknown function (DUF3592)
MKIVSDTVPPWMQKVGAVVWAAGGALTGYQFMKEVNALSLTRASLSWNAVEAVVERAEPVRGCGKSGTSYYPDVRYHFVLLDHKIEGTKISLGNFYCSDLDSIKEFIGDLHAGQRVTAWVNPRNPSQTILRPGELTGYSKFGALLMGVFAVGCTYFALRTWRDAA